MAKNGVLELERNLACVKNRGEAAAAAAKQQQQHSVGREQARSLSLSLSLYISRFAGQLVPIANSRTLGLTKTNELDLGSAGRIGSVVRR